MRAKTPTFLPLHETQTLKSDPITKSLDGSPLFLLQSLETLRTEITSRARITPLKPTSTPRMQSLWISMNFPIFPDTGKPYASHWPTDGYYHHSKSNTPWLFQGGSIACGPR